MWRSFQLIKADLNSSSKLYSQWSRICVWSGLSFHHPWVNFGVVKLASPNRTFGDATTAFSVKSRLRKDRRNSLLMTRQYPGMGSVSDWMKQISRAARTIRNATHTWVLTRHQLEFLRSFLRRHFAGKLVVGSRNVCCFPRLDYYLKFIYLWCPVINFIFSFHCLITASFHC